MASLLAHPLTDEVHFWNTRWRTRVDHEQRADVMDALQARPLPRRCRPAYGLVDRVCRAKYCPTLGHGGTWQHSMPPECRALKGGCARVTGAAACAPAAFA